MATKKRKATAPESDFPKVVETFQKPGYWMWRNLENTSPSAFNGEVNVRKYRVTYEEIEEPVEVYRERIIKLWRECDNHHMWGPLERAAGQVGITLEHKDFGIDRKGTG